ncbi:MAG: hypothetical protein ABI203_11515 [Mucilaginibacter sp.]
MFVIKSTIRAMYESFSMVVPLNPSSIALNDTHKINRALPAIAAYLKSGIKFFVFMIL